MYIRSSPKLLALVTKRAFPQQSLLPCTPSQSRIFHMLGREPAVVLLCVSWQKCVSAEPAETHSALEGSLPGVGAHMHHQIVLLSKRSRAYIAAERTFARVCPFMFFHGTGYRWYVWAVAAVMDLCRSVAGNNLHDHSCKIWESSVCNGW